MASVTGSFLSFDRPLGGPYNLVLTPDGTGATTVAGSGGSTFFNIEVFTSVAGAVGAGFDAAVFIAGAVRTIDATGATIPNQVRGGSLSAAESILGGASGFQLTDVTGFETIVGGASSGETIVGAAHDTLIG